MLHLPGVAARRAIRSGAMVAVALWACSFSINPDTERFSCEENGDCGEGYECIPQTGEGRGACFRLGACDAEESACDGRDEDCDGVVDDIELLPSACEAPLSGICRAGRRECASGVEVCVALNGPSSESCNGLDDDCDGTTDEDFDFTSDEHNCGECGHVCGDGSECLSGACAETSCVNGVDDDQDELADCDDPDCLGQTCDDGEQQRICTLIDHEEVDAGMNVDAALTPECVPFERTCDNGQDDDGDDASDCADPDCAGRACGIGQFCSAGLCQ